MGVRDWNIKGIGESIIRDIREEFSLEEIEDQSQDVLDSVESLLDDAAWSVFSRDTRKTADKVRVKVEAYVYQIFGW